MPPHRLEGYGQEIVNIFAECENQTPKLGLDKSVFFKEDEQVTVKVANRNMYVIAPTLDTPIPFNNNNPAE